MSKDRLTGMTALALQYPSLTLADEASPLKLWREGEQDRRAAVRAAVVDLLAELPDGEGKPDDRWSWAAPAMLDHSRGLGAEFLEGWTLEVSATKEEALETEGAEGDDTRFAEHVGLLRRVLAGEERLGRKPDDLAEVVTELALGAPGILAARSLAATRCSQTVRQRGAAKVAEGFRTLFNQPTAMEVVRREGGCVLAGDAAVRDRGVSAGGAGRALSPGVGAAGVEGRGAGREGDGCGGANGGCGGDQDVAGAGEHAAGAW